MRPLRLQKFDNFFISTLCLVLFFFPIPMIPRPHRTQHRRIRPSFSYSSRFHYSLLVILLCSLFLVGLHWHNMEERQEQISLPCPSILHCVLAPFPNFIVLLSWNSHVTFASLSSFSLGIFPLVLSIVALVLFPLVLFSCPVSCVRLFCPFLSCFASNTDSWTKRGICVVFEGCFPLLFFLPFFVSFFVSLELSEALIVAPCLPAKMEC